MKSLSSDIQRLLICLTMLAFPNCSDSNIAILSKSKPVLIILGTDISGTFSNYEKLPPQYLNEICQGIAESGCGGLVAAYPIGNPTDSAFVRCKILPKQSVDGTAPYGKQAKQAQEGKKVKPVNQKVIQTFIEKYNKSIYLRKYQKETDIQSFLLKAVALANEPSFEGYEKHIFIYSDGLQDVKGNKKLVFPLDEELEGIKFYGCGIQNQFLIDHLNIQKFEAPEGFIESITNHLSNKK